MNSKKGGASLMVPSSVEPTESNSNEIFGVTGSVTSSRKSSTASVQLNGIPKRNDSSFEEKSGPTEYQRLNSLEYLFSKYGKEMDAMRERFKGREEEDTILYRFLKAFNHDVEAASRRLEASLIWREENKFPEIMEKYKDCPYDRLPNFRMISRFYPHNENYGFDNDGNIIAITQQGKIDPIVFPLNISIQQMAEYQVPLIAKKIYDMTVLSHKTGVLCRGVMIVDLDGLGLKHLAPLLLEYLKSLAAMLQLNFPEVLHRSIVINAPKAFHVGWKAIKQFLEPGVQQKFEILGKDYHDELYKHFQRHQLPPYLGGTCPEVCIVDYEEGFETKEFYGSYEIPTLVDAHNDGSKKVVWDFRCEKEVKYIVEFFSENNSDSVEVQGKKKADAHRLTIGEWILPGPGKVVLSLKSPPLAGQNSVRYKISVAPVNEQMTFDYNEQPPEIKMPESEEVRYDLKKSASGGLTMNIQLSEDVFKSKMRSMEKKMDRLDDRFDEFDTKLKNSKTSSDRITILLIIVIVIQIFAILHSNSNQETVQSVLKITAPH
eukprot:TRINITY_DN11305_c0_g1_i1.p1 TRINITY_DN11305_c0_g1~~TRINITY_DN11305_c0_g1_i1.p1  ORF type:complete len:588 (-),score=138.98 TRINITY_DN11305_c0_g1_i1:36-1670(-)